MILISVMYPAVPGSRFDHTYYVQKHIPLVQERWTAMGLEHVVLMRGAATPDGSTPRYRVIAMLSFSSLEDFGKAAGAHGAEIFGDIPKFTDVTPVVQIIEPLRLRDTA